MADVLGPSLFRWDNAAGVNDAAQGMPQRRTSTKLQQEACIQDDSVNHDDDAKNVTSPTPRRNSEDKEKPTVVDALQSLSINTNSATTSRPSFLAAETVGPSRGPPGRRRPPARSQGFHGAITDLHQIPVKPIEFVGSGGGGRRRVQDGMARVLQEIVVKDGNNDDDSSNNNQDVTVLFAIRVPGCGECREHGLQLTELAEKENVSVKGVIKETGVDDEALLEFYTDYFNFPLYKDEGMNLFNIIGNEKLDTFTLLAKAENMHKRIGAKGIRGSPQVKGEGLTQGGVLIFDKKGKLCYVYYETFGHEFDMQAINWAVDSLLKS